MRGCTRCGATYATGVMFCPNDGASTVELPAPPAAPVLVRPPAHPAFNGSAGAPPPPVAPADPFIGKQVGNFRLSRRLGAGGMGAVYEAVHPIVGNRIAVKLLGGSFALDRDLVERFFAEARLLNQVAHDNIVRVIDLGAHPEGFYYCSMELLEGETLASVMNRGRLDLARALGVLVQACDALAAAHEKGIVHRDLKPANIMLVRHPVTGGDLVKLVDFGIAKLQTQQAQAHQTVTGTVIGTPAYMSPEQASGRVGEIDPRSDLYSLGIVAWELLTGRHPFEGKAVGELIVAQITEQPPNPAQRVAIPKRLDELVMRLLKKRRDERLPTAAAAGLEFRATLDELNAPERAPSPPSPRADSPDPSIDPDAAPPSPTSRVARPSVAVPAPPNASTSAPAHTPGTGVRLATREQPSRRSQPPVRPTFLLALLLAGAALGAATAGLVDAEGTIARVVEALGLASPPPVVKRGAPANSDGLTTAIAASPPLARCRPLLEALRTLPLPAAALELEPAMRDRLDRHERFVECLHGSSAPVRWAPLYVEGVAHYEFALALTKLDPTLRQAARELKDPKGGAPFSAAFFARLAASRFDAARPLAPVESQGLIDRYLVDTDVLAHRAAQEERSAQR